MPSDAVPPSRLGAPTSSYKAVRAGVLAALSIPTAAAPVTAETPPEPATAVPVQHPPARGFGASLRAAGRRGLLMARPLALPFLLRLQMRMRTAVNESDLATRTAGIEQALERLSERIDAEVTAARREVAGVGAAAAANARRLDAVGREIADIAASLAERSDAARREVAGVGAAAAANARRLDAIGAAADDNARRLGAMGAAIDDNARRLGAMGTAADGNALRLDAIQRCVASVSDAVHALAAHRPPVPVGDDFLVYTPDGVLLVPAEDLRFLAVIADGGVLEAGTRRVLAALLSPGGVFLDVGANVGTMTLLAARAVGPTGRVFAVEPTPRIAALLRRSMVVNDVADRVVVAACAAGEQEGEALLHLEDVMSHNTLFPQDGSEGRGTVRVQVRPADDLVPAGTPVDVAKIDAEGAELQVWRGMRRTLVESPNIAVVLEFGPSHLARVGVTPEAWLREVEAPGFTPYMIDDMTGVCRPASLSALGEVFSANILLLHPDAASRHPDLVFA